MMLYVAIFILGAIAVLALRRMVLAIVRWVCLIVGVVFAGRLAFMADDRLMRPEWMTGGIIGGTVAFVVVGLISYALIYHALIAADLRRDIEKAHDQAKRRRLW